MATGGVDDQGQGKGAESNPKGRPGLGDKRPGGNDEIIEPGQA